MPKTPCDACAFTTGQEHACDRPISCGCPGPHINHGAVRLRPAEPLPVADPVVPVADPFAPIDNFAADDLD